MWDNKARMEGAYAEGKNSKAVGIAINLFKKGMPVSEIVEITGLTQNELEELAK